MQRVVKALVDGDYALARGIDSVAPLAPATADQIRKYLSKYGETIAELPDETWETSVSQWMNGYWDTLVDLWTAESGASDLVLSARVFEAEDVFRIEIDSVHVP